MTNRLLVPAIALATSVLAGCTGMRLGGGSSSNTVRYGLESPCAPPCAPPAVAPCAPMAREEARDCCRPFFADYVPAVPVGPSRTMITTLAMPPTPWLLTEGEAGTPSCGKVGFNLVRISDERAFTDNNANRFEFDGEEQVATLEVVSPRLHVNLGCASIPFHVAASMSAYTLNYGWYDGLRNFVEGDIIGWDSAIEDAHTLQGRELSVSQPAGPKTDLLDSDPMWKARAVLKVPLREQIVDGAGIQAAVSLGVTSPSFGSHSDSGNANIAVDLTFALAIPISDHWRLTGAANLALPGTSNVLDDLGIDHQSLVLGGVASIEWWVSRRFAVAAGVTINGPYTRGSGLPTDLTTFYGNLGILWRPTEKSEVHLLFSENFEKAIAVEGTPSTSYSDSQKDADFSLTFGGSIDF